MVAHCVPSVMNLFDPGPIALGCMSLPLQNEGHCERILLRAADLGIQLFDTADLYDKGLNEERVGKALGLRRKEVWLATKVGNQWRPDGSGWDWNPRKAYILQAVDHSLRRLGTDYIDLYQLHGGTCQDPIDETIEAFERLVEAGKIRYYGLSSIRPNVVREYIHRAQIRSLMCQYSLADRRPEEAIIPSIQSKGIRLLARGVLARGMLCGKTPEPYLEHSAAALAHAAQVLAEVSSAERSRAQTAIRFLWHRYAQTTAVIGVSRLEQLEEMAATLLTPPLTDKEIDALTSALPVEKYTEHQ